MDFCVFCSEHDHKPQNPGCAYTAQSFHTAWAHCRPARALRYVRNRRKQTSICEKLSWRSIGPLDTTHTIRPSDARHLADTHGDTEGDTQGDSVSPSCIPLPACKLPRKYKTLADRSAIRINPDLPLGAPPLGPDPIVTPQCRIHFSKIQCSYSHRSSPSWLSARWKSSLHWGHC